MSIEEIKNGMLVMLSQQAEDVSADGAARRGALGVVDSPVFGSGGFLWWIVHQDGSQGKYRFYDFVEMKTIKVDGIEEVVIEEERVGE